jgi:pilus assembly protein CpaE
MAEQISFIIIDSSAASISDMKRILEAQDRDLKVVGTATSFEKGYELIFSDRPTVVIMEIVDEDIATSIGKIKSILSRSPRTFIFAAGGLASSEAILTLLRAGATEYLPKPVLEADLASAVRKLIRSNLAVSAEDGKGGIYSVFSPKGGSGVTTVAINLAANIFNETGQPTLVVDLDHTSADVGAFLNLQPGYTLQDAMGETKELDKMPLQNILAKHNSGIHVLPQKMHLEEAVPPTGESVRRLLDGLRGTFRHIVLDTEPHVSDATITAMQMSEAVLMVFVLSLPGIKNTQKYLDYLQRKDIAEQKIRLVVNRFNKKGDIPIAETESVLRQPVFSSIPNDYGTAIESLNRAMPFCSFAPHSGLNMALRDLALRVTAKGEDMNIAEGIPVVSRAGNFYRSLIRKFRET